MFPWWKSFNYDDFPFIKANFSSQASCHHPQNLKTLTATNTKQINKTNPLPFLACLLFVDVNGVFMLYCFYLIVCLGSWLSCWEEESFTFTKKASDTHNPISILLYALVFSSSMHDRYFVFQVYAMLRTPSSV